MVKEWFPFSKTGVGELSRRAAPGLVLIALALVLGGCVTSPRRDLSPSIRCKGITLILVPQGERIIGTNNSRALPWERPAIRFRLDYPLYIGMTEVTVGQFHALMGTRAHPIDTPGPYYVRPRFRDDLAANTPAFCSWEHAVYFCKRLEKVLAKQTGRRWECRLPREAEWEYAAVFGHPADQEWWPREHELYGYEVYDHGGPDARKGFQPVATKKPNALGLYDMLGNWDEWCDGRLTESVTTMVSDGWRADCPKSLLWASQGPRPSRGGSFVSGVEDCRPSRRSGSHAPTGFRVAALPK